MGIGLGAAGAIGSAVQAGQLSSLSNKVDEKASQIDLTSALDRIAVLEGNGDLASICASVS